MVCLAILRGVEPQVRRLQCTAWANVFEGELFSAGCTFRNVSISEIDKLEIERIGPASPNLTDSDIKHISFENSSVYLIHPDLLAKFPNIETVNLRDGEWQNQKILVNCNIERLSFHLTNVRGISNTTFLNCPELKILDVDTVSIVDFPDGVFKSLRNLRELFLTINGLNLRVKAFEGLDNLRSIYLNSIIGDIEENFFHSLTNLRHILFFPHESSYTQDFPFELLRSHPSLGSLQLGFVNMSQIPENFLPILRTWKNLTDLDLSHNLIETVEPFVDLPNLQWLVLWNNNIREIPANAFKGCPKVTTLYLSENPISSLPSDAFNQLSELRELSLSRIQLKRLEANTFQATPQLSYLYLHNNQIDAIHPNVFDHLKHLISLQLRNNTCVNEDFEAPENEVLDIQLVKEKLRVCFENF
jgi:Leucine-rich repeat (LRR) protein